MKTSSKLRRLRRQRKLRRQRSAALLVLITVMMFVMAHAAFSEQNTDTVCVETVTVTSGDTLWSIAAEYKPSSKDLREFVYEIAADNGVKDCEIYVGQTLLVPVS